MKSLVPAKFRMKRRCQDFFLLDQDDLFAVMGEYFYFRAHFLNNRRPDECCPQIFDVKGRDADVCMEAFDLAAVGVALYGYV